jgi:hypothetical protein
MENVSSRGFSIFALRAVNQDCLENLFSIIRQNGMGNTNRSCYQYQFTYALKTSVLIVIYVLRA